MNKQHHKAMVKGILKSLEKTLLDKLKDLPDEWDGIEIRQWIADTYANHFSYKMDRKRMKNYRNTRLVNNL